ncbi:hypothetical protein JMJ35_005432 [Cladonia borealis]|uniref:Mitochondrial import receptor subunit TOM20 n=1 Tax=Cladonia borealis TaxID=184061 RepID=A0AA39R1T6_9LECA|nr:hypothetical protein JMJ35_005432 [Cladonia borealis]
MSSSIRTSTILIASTGAIIAGCLGYAVYFDHKRRTDPEFRKALKRESRREARVAKEQAEVEGEQQKRAIKAAVNKAKEEGFPTDVEEREAYFMNEVGQGEVLCQDSSKQVESALCFYRALKVYPQPKDLIGIYDKTVPKPVIDILAEMIAQDPTINIGGGSPTGIDD